MEEHEVIGCQQIYSNRTVKGNSSNTSEMIGGRKVEPKKWKGATEVVNIIDYSLLEVCKICLMVERKN